jgi:hypothetical protein
MDIGPPKRIIEIEPVELPMPEDLPDPEPAPQQEPAEPGP